MAGAKIKKKIKNKEKSVKNPPHKPNSSWGGSSKATLTLLLDNHLTASHRFMRLQTRLALQRARQ